VQTVGGGDGDGLQAPSKHLVTAGVSAMVQTVGGGDGASPSRHYARNILRELSAASGGASYHDRSIKFLAYFSWIGWYVSVRRASFPGRGAASHRARAAAFRKFYEKFNDARFILRLHGTISSLDAALTGSWAGKYGDVPGVTSLSRFAASCMVLYHPAEHVAWVGWGAPGVVADPNRWGAWSCKFWVAFIVADLCCTALKMRELEKRDRCEEDPAAADPPRTCLVAEVRTLRFNFARSSLSLLPAVHWSLPRWSTHPLLKEPVLNGLMATEALVHAVQTMVDWRERN